MVCISSSFGMFVSQDSAGVVSSMSGTLASDESAISCCFSSAARDSFSNVMGHHHESPNASELAAWEEVLLCGHCMITLLVLCSIHRKKHA